MSNRKDYKGKKKLKGKEIKTFFFILQCIAITFFLWFSVFDKIQQQKSNHLVKIKTLVSTIFVCSSVLCQVAWMGIMYLLLEEFFEYSEGDLVVLLLMDKLCLFLSMKPEKKKNKVTK